MKVYDAYRMAVEAGMSKDIRPDRELQKVLSDAREAYEKTDADRQDLFDSERLWNPYSDTRFSVLSDEARDIEAETMMWGVDIGSAEVLLADRLRDKGQNISALVAHHPLGTARTCFPEVMTVQSDMYHQAGVPINVSEGLMAPRMDEVLRGVMGSNYNQAADAAKLLGMPLMNIHSPADNMVQDYLTRLMEKTSPYRLKDVIDVLFAEPEYREAARYNSPPKIMVGNKDSRCGKILCKMTGGTSGPKEIYSKLSEAGVGTVIGMHFPEEHLKEARENNVNIIISGHMSSDSVGINLICDIWEREGIKILPCSGFTRFSRN
ncbi:MAG: hypothetical protein J5494_05230 [Candidatus Methanomethylophilaceae archaeon]|nr:hypothetical protein [Candidatus Methanomethylophilaceae archaeon]